MSKSCPIVQSDCIFIGAQVIDDSDGRPTDNVYLNFICDELITDYGYVVTASAIFNSSKGGKSPKPNLKFRTDELTARGYSLKKGSAYRVKYAYEVSSFDRETSSGKDTVAYNRKWICSVEQVGTPDAVPV